MAGQKSERRIPIGITITHYNEMRLNNFEDVDNYIEALKLIIKKLQDANKQLQDTINNINNPKEVDKTADINKKGI